MSQASTAATGTEARYCSGSGAGCSYLESWEVQALRLQNRVDQDVPVRLGGWPHSHNAYNARADGYRTDPNHEAGVQRQLEMGVRSIAYDIAPYPSGTYTSGEHSLRLCHKLCSDDDMFLGQGLRILRDYLRSQEGRDEVVLLQLELNMPENNKGDFVRDVRRKIAQNLGDLVYRPPAGACTEWSDAVEPSLSKADVLAAGRNVVINSHKACFKGELQGWAFDGSWKNKIRLGHEEGHFAAYPACTLEGTAMADTIAQGFYRSYNDGTSLSNVTEPSSLTAEQMRKLSGCGVNALGPEPIQEWMARWKTQVWSWSPGEPSPPFGRYGRPPAENPRDCAVHGENDRFADSKCTRDHRFACQHPTTREWRITSSKRRWTKGEGECQGQFGDEGFVFAVPVNGFENNELAALKASRGIEKVWINYSDRSREGDWRPGTPVPAPPVVPTTHPMLTDGNAWNSGYAPTSIAFGDVDGDGLDEVGVTREAGGGDRWWIYDDAVHDFAVLRTGGDEWNSDAYPTVIAFGDIDGDGRDEVGLGRKASDNERYWILDDQRTGFATLQEGGKGWNGDFYVTSMAFGDVDGDGREEIGIAREANDNARWMILESEGGSIRTKHEGGRKWNSKSRARSIAFGDVDGDGRDEVGLGRRAESGARWFVYDDAGSGFATLHEGGSGWNRDFYPVAIAFGNVDGDAREEVGVVRNARDGDRYWVLDDANASFATLLTGGSHWGHGKRATDIAFGDIDGDGRDEVGVARDSNSHARYWLLDDAGAGFATLHEDGGGWNSKAYVRTIAFGRTFDRQIDIGLGRKAPDHARVWVLGWN